MPLITWPQRCSHPLCSSQSTDGSTTITTAYHNRTYDPAEAVQCDGCPTTIFAKRVHPTTGCSFPQDPTVCRDGHLTGHRLSPPPTRRRYSPVPHETTRPYVSVPPVSNHPETPARDMALGTHQPNRASSCQRLLRKEVIQPHLPVRLPCYDFVPIASPTFDGSLPTGLGHRLRVLPTFVT